MKLYIGDRVYQPTDIHPFGWGHGEVVKIDGEEAHIHWSTGRTERLSEISTSIKIDYQYRREKKLKELGI